MRPIKIKPLKVKITKEMWRRYENARMEEIRRMCAYVARFAVVDPQKVTASKLKRARKNPGAHSKRIGPKNK